MSVNKKLGYVKGLADGLDVSKTTPEGRLLLAIVDLLDEMAEEIEELAETVEDLEGDVEELADDFYDDEDLLHLDDDDDDDDEDEDEDDDDEDDSSSPPCPKCGTPIMITERILRKGFVTCPGCGQKLSLDIQDGCGEGCEEGCCCEHGENKGDGE